MSDPIGLNSTQISLIKEISKSVSRKSSAGSSSFSSLSPGLQGKKTQVSESNQVTDTEDSNTGSNVIGSTTVTSTDSSSNNSKYKLSGSGSYTDDSSVLKYMGIPQTKVYLKKRSYQYISPQSELDFTINDFHQDSGNPNIKSDNVEFITELGVAIVKPLIAKRNNYIEDSSVPNESRYWVEHPGNLIEDSSSPTSSNGNYDGDSPYSGVQKNSSGKYSETSQEMKRRVFLPKPTIIQYLQLQDSVNYLADFMYPWENWSENYSKNNWEYSGPIWKEISIGDGGPTSRLPVSWISQESSSPNVEWCLSQSQCQFTNQPFWVEVHKYSQTALTANDASYQKENKGIFSRYHVYGGERVDAFFGIRIGWTSSTFTNSLNITNTGAYAGYGPYDIIFPLDGAAFIWDHGSVKEGESDKDRNKETSYTGYKASTKSDWVISDKMKDFKVSFMMINGKMVMQSSFSSKPWIFPDNISDKIKPETKKKYEKFFMPPGNVCVLGRGFKFRMNFNPMEFTIYDGLGKKRIPSAKIYSKPFLERKIFPCSEKQSGGYIDYYNYLKGDFDFKKTQNFLCIPNATDDADVSGNVILPSYGCDIVTDGSSSPGMKLHNVTSNGFTSMMMGVNGTNPESWTTSNSPFYSVKRQPYNTDGASQTTSIDVIGFNTVSTSQVKWDNNIIEVHLNCQPPIACPTVWVNGKCQTSERFATPIFWRVKAKHVVPKPDDFYERISLDGIVKSVSYDTQCPNFEEVRQEYKLEVVIPKKHQWEDFPISKTQVLSSSGTETLLTRELLIDWLTDGVKEVEIYLGYAGASYYDKAITDYKEFTNDPCENVIKCRNRFPDISIDKIKNVDYDTGIAVGEDIGYLVKTFTGLCTSGPIKNSYSEDIISLKCVDRIKILEDTVVQNSPFYDGMSIENAFKGACTLTGLTSLANDLFDVKSNFASNNVLGMGYTFATMLVKFDSYSSLYDGIKSKIVTPFWHVLMTDPDGKIVLTDLNYPFKDEGRLTKVDDIPISHSSYVFYINGADIDNANRDPFQICYGSLTVEKDSGNRFTGLSMGTANRFFTDDTPAILYKNSFDQKAIEDPSSHNFIGYTKNVVQIEAAFGSEEKLKNAESNYLKHIYEPPIKINFTTFGRPTLRPFDIIKVVFPNTDDEDVDAAFHLYLGDSKVRECHFRVVGISGKMSLEGSDQMLYSMNIIGERI